MQYTKKDLKSIDGFALILIGLGVMFLVIGLPQLLGSAEGKAYGGSGKVIGKIDDDFAASGVVAGKGKTVRNGIPGLSLTVVGFIFILLGVALNLGVRRVIRNNGRDVASYPGVPEPLPDEEISGV